MKFRGVIMTDEGLRFIAAGLAIGLGALGPGLGIGMLVCVSHY